MPAHPVGLPRRLAAAAYDALLLFGILFAATLLVLPFTGGQAIRPGNLLFAAYLLAVGFLFFGWFWTHGGQTLGMRAWRIELVSEDGTRVGWRQCLVRCAAALISWAALGLGFWWALWDPRGLTWHDRASRTRLVYRERP